MLHPERDQVAIYTLSDPRTPNNVRYVGKTSCLKSRFVQHVGIIGSDRKSEWVESLWEDAGLAPKMTVVEIVYRQEASYYETLWIKKFDSEELLNMYRSAGRPPYLADGLSKAEGRKVLLQKAIEIHGGDRLKVRNYLQISNSQLSSWLKHYEVTLPHHVAEPPVEPLMKMTMITVPEWSIGADEKFS